MNPSTRLPPLHVGRRWAALTLALCGLLLAQPAAAAPTKPPLGAEADRHGLRALEPVRGHYARLAQRSPEPASGAQQVDVQKFQHPPAHIERTLSQRPHYLSVDASVFRLPPRPANSSPQTRAELDYLLRLQERRTAEDVHEGLYWADWGYSIHAKPEDRDWERVRDNLFLVGHSVGTWFNPGSLPRTADLLHKVWRDARFYVWSLKYQHARVRPYVLEPRLKNLQETGWAAFPSGHASYAYLLAYLYAELAPDLAPDFLQDAREIAHSREVLGVHYPSDSEAGRVFARQLVNLLLESPRFQRDLAGVREEWRQVRGQLE